MRPIPAESRDADDERRAPSSCKLREGGATGVMSAAYVTAYCPLQPVHRETVVHREGERNPSEAILMRERASEPEL